MSDELKRLEIYRNERVQMDNDWKTISEHAARRRSSLFSQTTLDISSSQITKTTYFMPYSFTRQAKHVLRLLWSKQRVVCLFLWSYETKSSHSRTRKEIFLSYSIEGRGVNKEGKGARRASHRSSCFRKSNRKKGVYTLLFSKTSFFWSPKSKSWSYAPCFWRAVR